MTQSGHRRLSEFDVLREQIQMEGWEGYLKKRPLLYVPFFVAAALLLPALARFMSALGFH